MEEIPKREQDMQRLLEALRNGTRDGKHDTDVDVWTLDEQAALSAVVGILQSRLRVLDYLLGRFYWFEETNDI